MQLRYVERLGVANLSRAKWTMEFVISDGNWSITQSAVCDGVISLFFRSKIKLEFIMQQSQTEQKEKEWQYRSIFDAANDGLIINDLETASVRIAEQQPFRKTFEMPQCGE